MRLLIILSTLFLGISAAVTKDCCFIRTGRTPKSCNIPGCDPCLVDGKSY
ncbi:hypothetical protein Ptr902_04337 [Pyrenophora tritici-repentis]|nr:hypothetical protein Alg130_07530 [Pyrenophora tritici-repentis]KAI2485397.1 hypothetical protein Ptr902_04337 [Pyrenophora tritici-repentis]